MDMERNNNKMETVLLTHLQRVIQAANWQLWRWWHIDSGSAGKLPAPSLCEARGKKFLLWGFVGGNFDSLDDACGPLGWGWMRTFGCQYWGSLSGSVRSPLGNEKTPGAWSQQAYVAMLSCISPHHPYLSRDGISATSHLSASCYLNAQMLTFLGEFNLLQSPLVTLVQRSIWRNTLWSWRARNESNLFFQWR